jgi:prevent-host-death family protein
MTFLGKVENVMEKVLGVTEARKKFSSIVEQVQCEGDTYLISRYGKPAAALVPVEVYDNWRQHQREMFFDLVRDMQKEADLSPKEADRAAQDAVAGIRNEG